MCRCREFHKVMVGGVSAMVGGLPVPVVIWTWALLAHLIHGQPHLGDYRTVDVVRNYGYDAEEHTVTTEDGYLLCLTRIKSTGTKLPVLMVHGVIAASDQWVARGPRQDLAFILADEGHDVWLGDQRGNFYSRNHTYLNPSLPDFWDFSFHESGLYDLPAFIDTVLEQSGAEQVLYVGHSMGTTVYYVMGSLRPEYNALVRTAVHISPIAFGVSKQLTPALQLLLNNVHNIAVALKGQKIYQFMPRSARNLRMTEELCTQRSKSLCLFVLSQLYGPETLITNTSLLTHYVKRLQSGTSIKTMIHLSQIYKSKNFVQYDHGKKHNYEMYKSKTPPAYPLNKVSSPVALYYSDKDAFIDQSSIDRLSRELPNIVSSVSIPRFNHIDMLFADDAANLIYSKIVKLFNDP